MSIKSTTSKSNSVFGYLREAIKYGTLMAHTTYPSNYFLATKRLNCNNVYCDQYYTTTFKKLGNAKLRLYKNDLEITINHKVITIPDLDRYYVERPIITIQKTDSTITDLCNEILRLLYKDI
jgi:hypothetical protein